MRDPPREPSDGFHFLRLPKLILELLPGGHVARDSLNTRSGGISVWAHVELERKAASFLAENLQLEGWHHLAFEHTFELAYGIRGVGRRHDLAQVDAARVFRAVAGDAAAGAVHPQ